MSDNIHGNMVYSFKQPMWHAITAPSLEPLTAEEILDQRFHGGFEILLRPVTVTLNGVPRETGDFAVVRGKSPCDNLGEIVFAYCTERYKPLQPREICHCFDINVLDKAETMAFLGKGEEMFISWKMPKFEVKPGDEVDLYGIVRSGFNTMKATRLFISAVRPVCWNTVTMAEGWAKANKSFVWKGKAVNHNLLRDLGYWMSHVQTKAITEANLLQSFFRKLATKEIKSDIEARSILSQAYPDKEDVSAFYPKQLSEGQAQKTNDYNIGQEDIRNGIYALFNGDGTAITPDYWGMLNATSEYFCHVFPSKRPIAESVMFGGRQQKIMQMVETLKERSK